MRTQLLEPKQLSVATSETAEHDTEPQLTPFLGCGSVFLKPIKIDAFIKSRVWNIQELVVAPFFWAG